MTAPDVTPPHCDQSVLHAPGECSYCDRLPEWQALRRRWGIAFTGHPPAEYEVACPSDARRGLGQAHAWGGNRPTAVEPVVAESRESRWVYLRDAVVGLRRPRDSGDQPLPVANDQPTIHEQVCADVMQRQALGISRYGQPLQPHNGRDALLDLYQELLDAIVYLRQFMEEQR